MLWTPKAPAVASASLLRPWPPKLPISLHPSCVLALLPQNDPKWFDYSDHGNHGVVHGATPTAKGRDGFAWEFDGNDQINCRNDASLNLTDAITIVAWIHNGGSTRFEHIVAKRTEDIQTQYGLLKTADNRTMFQYGTATGRWQNVTGDSLPLNRWAHTAIMVRGLAYNFYIDGQSAGSGNLANTIPSLPIVPVIVGFYDGPNNEWWIGLISEVRIYNQAWSPRPQDANYLPEIDPFL